MTMCMMGCGRPAWACSKCIDLACEKSADYAITANEKIVRASAREAAEGVLGEAMSRLEAANRECDVAMVRAAKAEYEVSLWRRGNPSDDLWRVRMEQAEAALDEQKAELLRVVTALHGADASLREHMAWVAKLRTALTWARACLPLSCLGNKNGEGATLGEAIDAALRGGE